MLGPPYIEDFFVLSSVHDYPWRVIQLEGYMHHFVRLIENSLQYIKDEKTAEFLQRVAQNARVSWENLGRVLFEKAKAKQGLPMSACFWPEDFPTIKILGCEKTTVKCFTIKAARAHCWLKFDPQTQTQQLSLSFLKQRGLTEKV
ncbi:MAG: hypothetical protein JSV05_05585 [Candidatus Bathyarchaeota archaeon]|nr:MAG: hypothetical protein JSV05_05585 [Candidatus Bathyarchaeota archaeon]